MKKKKSNRTNDEMLEDAINNAENSVFENSGTDENNMFSEENTIKADAEKQTKKKGKPIGTIAITLVALAAIVFVAPIVFVNLGDSAIAKGNYENAATFYKLCFGTNNSSRRLEAANAIKLIKDGNTEEGINLLLDNDITVNIKYDLSGGSFINSDRKTDVTINDKTEFGDLYKARKDYYSFENWSLVTYSYAPDFDDSAFDVSLKAIFSLNNYKISYTNLFSEKIDNPQEYNYETSTITLKNPSRSGYTFLYWKGTDINGQATTVVIPQGSYGDRAYIANWAPNKYIVTLNPDVECEIENPITVTFDDDYALPEIYKRGYTHTGWSDGKDTYFNGVWTTLNDISVTPVWEINNYTLTYNLSGGKLEQSNPTSYTVLSEDIPIAEPTRFGYTFQGWLHSEKNVPEKNVVIKQNSIGNFDFTAVWKGNPHKITLDASGGNVASSVVNVVFGNEYSLPNPSRTGYTFTGWYNGNTKYTNGTWNQDNDLKVIATWNANKYKVSLNANGGNVSSNNIITTYDSQYSLPTPIRYGYTFTGWYNGSSKFLLSGVWNNVSDIALTAGWQGNSHIVSLDPNGGVASASSVNVVFGNSYTIPTPTKKGHTFAGWYNASSKYPDSGTWDKDDDIPLTANWTVNTYEAKLNTSGGSANTSSVSCKYGSQYTLPTPTRTGYTFSGWYSGSSKVQTAGTWEWDGNLNIEAKWEPNQYTITFDANDGSVTPGKLTVTYDASYKLPTPKKKGYTFTGWYNGYTKYSDGVWKKNEDLSLRASWEVNTYKATFDTNGGSVSKNYITCDYGSRYSLPTPSREGYTFDGWYNDSDMLSNYGTWSWDKDLVLEAGWEANRYTVSLYANGGYLSEKKITVTYDKKYSLPIPERKGYAFVGWYSSSYSYNYSSTEYASSGTWKYAKDVSLTAKWVEEYTIELDANGGTVSENNVTVTYNSSYSLPSPTRNGYSFLGWYYNGNAFSSSGTWKYEKDITLTAKWKGIDCAITLNPNGGNVSLESVYVTYGERYTLPTPSRDGYEFEGWFNGNSKIGNSGTWMIDEESIVLIAQWNIIETQPEASDLDEESFDTTDNE